MKKLNTELLKKLNNFASLVLTVVLIFIFFFADNLGVRNNTWLIVLNASLLAISIVIEILLNRSKR